LEALEQRCVPTVTTSFNPTTGALTITGSSARNNITVTENGATKGNYLVAVAADTISGSTTFTGVTSIAIDTLRSDLFADTVDFIGDPARSSFLSGTLSVTGSGDLTIGFSENANFSGAVNLSRNANVGRLRVQTGPTISSDPGRQGECVPWSDDDHEHRNEPHQHGADRRAGQRRRDQRRAFAQPGQRGQ
jgi:hypothetical protein